MLSNAEDYKLFLSCLSCKQQILYFKVLQCVIWGFILMTFLILARSKESVSAYKEKAAHVT